MVPVSLYGVGEVLESAGLIPSHPQRQGVCPCAEESPHRGLPHVRGCIPQ